MRRMSTCVHMNAVMRACAHHCMYALACIAYLQITQSDFTMTAGGSLSLDGMFMLERQSEPMIKAAISAINQHLFDTYHVKFEPRVIYTDDDSAGSCT